MATRFAVASGTWDGTNTAIWASVSGGAPGASPPTSADDVVLDAASGAVTLTTGNTGGNGACRNLTCTGFTGTLSGGVNVFGSIVFSATMTTTAGTLPWLLNSTGSTACTITSAGKAFLNTVNVQCGTGSYTLADAATFSGAGGLALLSGTFATADFAVSAAQFASSNSTTRTLSLGSSAITVTSNAAGAWDMSITTGLTFNAGTSSVTFTGTFPSQRGAVTFYDLTFTSQGASVAATQMHNLTVTGFAGKTAAFTFTANHTITGTVALNGNSTVNRMLVSSGTAGTARTVTVAAVSAANVDLMDITGAGAASWNLAAITGGSGDAGGNSGITFTSSTTRYAVVAGNWSSTAMWSTSSGGAGGASVPLPQDDVVLDANSGAGTYTVDMPRVGRDFTSSAFTRTLTFATSLTFYGSVTLGAGYTLNTASQPMTYAGRGTHTITFAGRSPSGNQTFAGPGGTYTLQDAFSTSVGMTLNAGTLNTNGFAVTVATFNSTATTTRALTLGTSTVSLTSTSASTVWNVSAPGLTLSAASSTIVISVASANARLFLSSGGAQTYGTITYTVGASTGALTITASTGTVIGTLNVSGGARTLTWQQTNNITVNNWNVYGMVGAVVTINTTTAGIAATISKATGYIASDYVSVQDITGTGGATFYMGSRSTSVSGNTGLSFTDAPQRFWVGGTATWDATVGTKWAVVSGGTGGLAVPTSSDDVYLDANSGAVTITAAGAGVAVCKSLICTGYTGTFSGGNVIVSGSAITLSATGTFSGLLLQVATTTCTLTSAGKTLNSFGTITTGATVTLADALSVTTLTITSGTFITNGFAVTCGSFSSSTTNTRTLTLGSSSVTITSTSGGFAWTTGTSTGLTVSTNTAVVTSTGATATVAAGSVSHGGISFVLAGAGVASWQPGSGLTGVANLTRTGTALKTDALVLNGNTTVTGTFTVNGNSATNRVLVQSNVVGTARTVTTATVVASNVDLMDITGAGAASWNLSAITGGSGDAGGNSGITFTTGAVNYWVGGTGNWSDITHWANSSGGVGGTGRVPLPQGTARFDANSFTGAGQIVTLDMPRLSKDVDWTGATNSPTLLNASTSAWYFGSWTLIAAMTWTSGAAGVSAYGRGSHTITMAGQAWANSTSWNGPGGTYTLQDAFRVGSSVNTMSVNAGTLVTNGFSVTTGSLLSSSTFTRAVDLGSSVVTLNGTGVVWQFANVGTLNTVSAASATVLITSTSATARTFASGGVTLGTLTYTAATSATLSVTGSGFTVGTLNVSNGAKTLTFTSSGTFTVTNWNVFGTAGNLVTVSSNTAGISTNLVKGGTDVADTDYLTVIDVAGSPAARWYAGTHSTDGGGNTGWTFTAAPTTQVGSQVDVRWATRAPVTSSRAVRWDTHALVTASRSLRWGVRITTGSTRDLRWAARLLVGAQRDVRWQTRTPVGASRAVRWDTHAVTGRSVALRWDAHLTVGSTRELRWAATALVGSSVQTVWQTRTHATSDVRVRWNTQLVVGSTRELRWTEHLTVGSQRNLRWTMTLPIRSGIYGGRLDGTSRELMRGGTLTGRRL